MAPSAKAVASSFSSYRPYSFRTVAERVLKRGLLKARQASVTRTLIGGTGDNIAFAERRTSFPEMDVSLMKEKLASLGIDVRDYVIDREGFSTFIRDAEFPRWYYGGGNEENHRFTEKALEHYVACELLDLANGDVYMDAGADRSPFAGIAERVYGCTGYRLDAGYRPGVHGPNVGGDARSVPLPNASIDKIGSHCAFDHFQGDADVCFIREASRLLRPGGRFCIAPLYLAEVHTNFVDSRAWLRTPSFDDGAAIVEVAGWGYDYSRFYSPETLVERLCRNSKGLSLRVHAIEGVTGIDERCYLRLAAVFTKDTA